MNVKDITYFRGLIAKASDEGRVPFEIQVTQQEYEAIKADLDSEGRDRVYGVKAVIA